MTYHGTVLVYSLADSARPARTTTVRGLLASARNPDGSSQQDETLCAACSLASYAVAFSPEGHTPTVVVDREEMSATSGHDTVFAWHVTGSGASAPSRSPRATSQTSSPSWPRRPHRAG